MYSFATSATFAVFTIASAASTDPMSPFVSTSPSASCATDWSSRETVTHGFDGLRRSRRIR
jgi:hypothetical protein